MPDSKTSIEHQRRLNPPMQEVVKKEITKFLDVGVIYPIAYCSWVYPVHSVPKKGGITVIPNAKNELVPMRPVTGWREPLAVVFAFQKFGSYLLGTKMGIENQVADHSSRLEEDVLLKLGDGAEINDSFPDEQVLAAYLSFQQRNKLMHDVNKFFWDEPYLLRICVDGIIHRCVPEVEVMSILEVCQSSSVGWHDSCIQTAHTIIQCGYDWPTIHHDAHDFVKSCDRCQREGGISESQELPMNPILVIELSDFTMYQNGWKQLRFQTIRKYGVLHNIATPYHLQPGGQVEVSNREIK
ncbi:uncharacterized protein LOC125863841 [Solanum stenotomum]|uniref:uncharacterized protein LOC125863841 n=1 Tax=Solanum stenotomum TaxID=172797 RepID=UPI0020D1796C|nr:uncharacterized protein LOC125863841 [Solanum stenotomum]